MPNAAPSRRAGAALFAVLCLSGLAMSSGDPARSPLDAYEPVTEMADGPLEALGYFAGTWELEATWAWGDTLHARNVYELGPGGRSLSVRTIVSDNGEKPYERYLTVFTLDPDPDPDQGGRPEGRVPLKAHGFNHDGSVTVIDSTLIVGEDGAVAIRSLWESPEGMTIDQSVERVDEARYRWVVDMAQPGDPNTRRVMDDEYVRVGG